MFTLTFLLISSLGHADVPWLKALAVCHASIAGADGRSGVMRYQEGAATEPQKDESLVYLGENATAFFGDNGKKAGLWIVNERDAYFADLENAKADTKMPGTGVWNLKIHMAGRPTLHSAFGYFDQAEGPKKWKILTSAFDSKTNPIGEQQKGGQDVEARKLLTTDLQNQMQNRIMGTLKRWGDTIAPNGFAQGDQEVQAILRDLEKRDSKPVKAEKSAVEQKEERNLIREKQMVDGIAKCRKAIEGRKEFGNIGAMMNLLERHIATKRELNPRQSDDTKPDAAL